jgi:hypothetical protein
MNYINLSVSPAAGLAAITDSEIENTLDTRSLGSFDDHAGLTRIKLGGNAK